MKFVTKHFAWSVKWFGLLVDVIPQLGIVVVPYFHRLAVRYVAPAYILGVTSSPLKTEW